MATKLNTPDLNLLAPVLERYAKNDHPSLIPALFEAQAIYGYLHELVIEAIGKHLCVPLAEIHGVIEFYSMLYAVPIGRTMVRVCTSPMCAQAGGREALRAARAHLGIEALEPADDREYMVEEVPCIGLCDHAPAALIGDTPVSRVDAASPGRWIKDPQAIPLSFVGGEPRWLTGRCGEIEPTDLSAFEAHGGFAGLRRSLEQMQPGEVVDEIKASALMGRGGAAFPTGIKWEYTAAAQGETRYVVCNGDESEPGTFKDRLLMEGDPYAILEGMIIAGYAIGAHRGYLYIRGEYPRAHRILGKAIHNARAGGYLGEDVLGSEFSFEIEIRSGAGAYVCGEETALFESIEGKRGYPRLKPPFPTTDGLFGQPTVINNVETLCAAAWILNNGAAKYRSIGTEASPGSKLFCLSGDVAHRGVYEVPFGIQLCELIDLAGGVDGDLQAILLGGAAGAFAGQEDLALSMSFEGLQEAGLPLGSGVVTVINKERDIGQFLLSLAHFFAHESCGKCFPCQLGTQRQLEIISRWVDGEAKKSDLSALRDIGFAMTNASLCGLGMTASTAIVSAFDRWPSLWQ
ncbi:MAG: NAD(P)H-dependent oxidoreductase subunit E [Anaerolineales bacterium]